MTINVFDVKTFKTGNSSEMSYQDKVNIPIVKFLTGNDPTLA